MMGGGRATLERLVKVGPGPNVHRLPGFLPLWPEAEAEAYPSHSSTDGVTVFGLTAKKEM